MDALNVATVLQFYSVKAALRKATDALAARRLAGRQRCGKRITKQECSDDEAISRAAKHLKTVKFAEERVPMERKSPKESLQQCSASNDYSSVASEHAANEAMNSVSTIEPARDGSLSFSLQSFGDPNISSVASCTDATLVGTGNRDEHVTSSDLSHTDRATLRRQHAKLVFTDMFGKEFYFYEKSKYCSVKVSIDFQPTSAATNSHEPANESDVEVASATGESITSKKTASCLQNNDAANSLSTASPYSASDSSHYVSMIHTPMNDSTDAPSDGDVATNAEQQPDATAGQCEAMVQEEEDRPKKSPSVDPANVTIAEDPIRDLQVAEELAEERPTEVVVNATLREKAAAKLPRTPAMSKKLPKSPAVESVSKCLQTTKTPLNQAQLFDRVQEKLALAEKRRKEALAKKSQHAARIGCARLGVTTVKTPLPQRPPPASSTGVRSAKSSRSGVKRTPAVAETKVAAMITPVNKSIRPSEQRPIKDPMAFGLSSFMMAMHEGCAVGPSEVDNQTAEQRINTTLGRPNDADNNVAKKKSTCESLFKVPTLPAVEESVTMDSTCNDYEMSDTQSSDDDSDVDADKVVPKWAQNVEAAFRVGSGVHDGELFPQIDMARLREEVGVTHEDTESTCVWEETTNESIVDSKESA